MQKKFLEFKKNLWLLGAVSVIGMSGCVPKEQEPVSFKTEDYSLTKKDGCYWLVTKKNDKLYKISVFNSSKLKEIDNIPKQALHPMNEYTTTSELTKEEILFLNGLRKDEYVENHTIFTNLKRFKCEKDKKIDYFVGYRYNEDPKSIEYNWVYDVRRGTKINVSPLIVNGYDTVEEKNIAGSLSLATLLEKNPSELELDFEYGKKDILKNTASNLQKRISSKINNENLTKKSIPKYLEKIKIEDILVVDTKNEIDSIETNFEEQFVLIRDLKECHRYSPEVKYYQVVSEKQVYTIVSSDYIQMSTSIDKKLVAWPRNNEKELTCVQSLEEFLNQENLNDLRKELYKMEELEKLQAFLNTKKQVLERK